MRVTPSFAFGLLVAAVPASAQVVTREITQQPVETTVTRYPDQTVITRRPLPAVGTIGVEPGVAPAYNPYSGAFPAAPAVTETIGAPMAAPAESIDGTRVRAVTVRREAAAPALRSTAVRTARTKTVRQTTATRPARTAHRAPATMRPAARTSIRTATTRRVSLRPLILSAPQRRVIYQNILQQQVVAAPVVPAATEELLAYPPVPTVIQPGAVTGYAVPYPAQALPAYPPSAYASAPYPVATTVGTALPASVRLSPMPPTVVMQVPQARRYSYAVVNNRVLLVDPVTGTIVADVTQ